MTDAGADGRGDRLRRWLDALPAAIFLKDGAGRYVECNEAFVAFAGCPRSEILGKTDWGIFPQELASEMVWQDMALRNDGGIRQFEFSAARAPDDPPGLLSEAEPSPEEPRPLGRCYLVVKSLCPRDSEGAEIAGIQVDISGRKREEEDLRASLEAAEEASRSKGDFLASMSHEIRTPLNAILGMTDLMLAMDASQEHRDLLENVRISGQSLLEIVNDVLDLSKIEAHRLVLVLDLFSPRQSLEVALRPMDPLARGKGLFLDLVVAPGVPAVVLGDEIRFRQVVVNLVSNAIKYTDQGGVSLTVTARRPKGEPSREEAKASRGDPGGSEPFSARKSLELTVVVRDTGVGIPASRLPDLFQSFCRVEGGMARKRQGTGLGLFISKRLVEAMGGTIGVESREGKGSAFSFTVRLGVAPEGSVIPRPEGRDREPVRGLPEHLRVLLAEDNPMNSKLARILLERKGWSVDGAENGHEALRRSRSQSYDLILMDVQMPEMDGLEATALIRQEEKEGERVPIIAMTAYTMKGDRERCLEAGMDGYVSKPISPEELFRTIAEVLGQESREASGPLDLPRGGVDLSRLQRIVGGDRGILKDVIQEFLDRAPGMGQALGDALGRGALAEAQKAVHKLRGSVSYFGVAALTALGERLEESCKGGNLEEAKALWPSLDRALGELMEEIKTIKSSPAFSQDSEEDSPGGLL